MIIFKHIPKTAGASIKEILPEKVNVQGHDFYNSEYKHLFNYISNLKNKFVFAFVRNPFDRIVSAFFYLNAGGNNPLDEVDREKYIKQYNGDFNLFVENAFPEILKQIHFMPQYSWIYFDIFCLCDYIGKIETINNDLQNIGNIINYDFPKLPKKNVSSHNDYRSYYTSKTEKIIYKYYEKDFKLFNYRNGICQ
jgi:hypothetical protein